MKKFKTNREIELLDKRQKPIGNFILRFIVNSVTATSNGVSYSGFYYYKNDHGQDEVLDSFNKQLSWEIVEGAEQQLPKLDTQNLLTAFLQRIKEFSFMQQQVEAGENWGTTAEDWIEDNE